MTLGLVCDACDALSPINATVCQLCGASLGVGKKAGGDTGPKSAVEPFGSAAAAAPKVCAFCGDAIAPGHRFCGNCGKPISSGSPASAPAPAAPSTAPGRPGSKPAAKTMFFGAMQAPSPKLILIKGEGMDGVTYVLSWHGHIARRLGGAILFPEGPLALPR